MLLLSCGAAVAEAGPSPSAGSLTLHYDNDFLAGGGRDRDYTWGFTVTAEAKRHGGATAPLEHLRRLLAGEDGDGHGDRERMTWQLGLLALTPGLNSGNADRPYASLLSLSRAASRLHADERRATSSALTVGVLGLRVAGALQNTVHRWTGDDPRTGWSNQLSDGGEPTARYQVARHVLLSEVRLPASTVEVKWTQAVSVGYLTEASVAAGLRGGQHSAPWWTFTPELRDYNSAPTHAPPEVAGGWYGFAGIRLRWRAYNALLQGQFRGRDDALPSRDLQHGLAEAWAGAGGRVGAWQVALSLHVSTPELKRAPGRRPLSWASLMVQLPLD